MKHLPIHTLISYAEDSTCGKDIETLVESHTETCEACYLMLHAIFDHNDTLQAECKTVKLLINDIRYGEHSKQSIKTIHDHISHCASCMSHYEKLLDKY